MTSQRLRNPSAVCFRLDAEKPHDLDRSVGLFQEHSKIRHRLPLVCTAFRQDQDAFNTLNSLLERQKIEVARHCNFRMWVLTAKFFAIRRIARRETQPNFRCLAVEKTCKGIADMPGCTKDQDLVWSALAIPEHLCSVNRVPEPPE